MPSNMLDSDVGFPRFTGKETREDQINQILNYLFMLQEQLRYSLSHIGIENFNDASLVGLTNQITDPINARIENDEGQIAALQVTAEGLASDIEDANGNISLLQQTAEQLASEIQDADGNISLLQQTAQQLTSAIADADGNISVLQQTVNGFNLTVMNADGTYSNIGIGGGTISMQGLVTFQDLSGSGSTVINGDNITTGTLTGISVVTADADRPDWVPGPNPSVKMEYGRIMIGDSLNSPFGTRYGEIYAVQSGADLGIAINGYSNVFLNGYIYMNGQLVSSPT